MIVLTVISHNGLPSNIAAVQIDELGGTIGRADNNQLVLPDQDRTISRLHAQVVYRSGHYAVLDLGANAVLHNGQPIGHGREAPIQPGDELEIGGYKIAVASGNAAVAKVDDPFAGFESAIAAPPQKSPPVARAPVPAPPKPIPQSSLSGGIPDDWDPFMADRPSQPINPTSFAPGSPAAPPSVQFGEPSLDDLFGLGGGAAPSAAIPPATRDDHASEMNVPWTGGVRQTKACRAGARIAHRRFRPVVESATQGRIARGCAGVDRRILARSGRGWAAAKTCNRREHARVGAGIARIHARHHRVADSAWSA